MDRLPMEITHMIFARFKGRGRAIALLRLVCKTFAAVGLHYLVPEVHLIFKSSSFQHLREVSEHPVISQHVETLFYEADTLSNHWTMKQWKKRIIVPGWFQSIADDKVILPPPTASTREQRAYTRDMKRRRAGPRYTQSEKQLKIAYEKYQSYLSDQNSMRVCDYNAEAIREALIRMPNLKNIDMSMECCLYESRSTKADRAFGDGYQTVFGDNGQKESCGVPQMRSLLLDASHAGLKLQSLRCGNIHWEIFKQSGKIFEEMKKAIQYLTMFNLQVTTRISDDGSADSLDSDDHHSQIPACAEYLKESGRLRKFVIAAPDLKVLDISFDMENPYPPAGLKQIVGDFTWHSLQHLAFNVLQTTEDELVELFSRHASTLNGIVLDTIKLTKGPWPRLLQRMRKTLCLEEAMIHGRVTSTDPKEDFDFGFRPEHNDGVPSVLSSAVERYLILGGDGPLLNLSALSFLEDEDSEPESDWHELHKI
ncbi:MAG: hypothetical protein ASARMPREDX12_009286 [Alectoria sarmentosa]|nr:MAG: hypothetical protein ASARMPREDX12_009286 [Alectoria sarmentosa]